MLQKQMGQLMEGIEPTQPQLPGNLEDLSRFVLFTQERITSMRAEIRAVKSLKLAKEIERQKKWELQEAADQMLDAQVIIGKLTSAIPKADGS